MFRFPLQTRTLGCYTRLQTPLRAGATFTTEGSCGGDAMALVALLPQPFRCSGWPLWDSTQARSSGVSDVVSGRGASC